MRNDRRTFIKQSMILTGGITLAGALPSCLTSSEQKTNNDLKISLAQWSLHKALFSGEISALDFPVIARQKFNVGAVEYVNQFFMDKAKDTEFLNTLKKRCEDNDVQSILIMIDGEGELADDDETKRKEAVENHFKWVEAAKYLGCHAIRVNLHGSFDPDRWKNASRESLQQLTEFGAMLGINILAENHGGLSSDAAMLAEVVKSVNHKNCGTLPDFNNFCVRREKEDLWESPCVEWYDRYKGIEELLPFAKGISAKCMDFDENGNETSIDYPRMIRLVRDSGYKGYLGVEYEGSMLSEEEGIRAGINLLTRAIKEVGS